MSVYQLTIGDIECAVLQDAEFSKTPEKVAERYPTVNLADIKDALGGTDTLDSINCLYINSGGTRILADVGFGGGWEATTGNLKGALESIGVGLADIDIVFLTHFHGDHVAGLVVEEGRLDFPNARFLTTQAEWDEWMERWGNSDSAGDQRNLARFMTLRDRFTSISPGDAIADGVTVVDLAGHTNGHAGLLVESQGQRLFHAVDLLHQAFQFARLEWPFVFDSDSELAVQTRRRVLQHCVDEDLLTLFYHLDFPGLGKVTLEDGTYVWNPTG